jgi:chromosome segregation ATPase
MAKIKDISLRSFYEKKLRKLEQDLQKKVEQLNQYDEPLEQREIILRRQLVDTHSALDRADLQIENLRKELERQLSSTKELTNWKSDKTAMIAEAQTKSEQFKRWNSLNVDKLVLNLRKKDQEIKGVKSKLDNHSRETDLLKEQHRRELKELKKKLKEERNMKLAALHRLEIAQGDAEKLKRALRDSSLEPDVHTVSELLSVDGLQDFPIHLAVASNASPLKNGNGHSASGKGRDRPLSAPVKGAAGGSFPGPAWMTERQ